MKHKTVNGWRTKFGITGFLLAGLIGLPAAANIAYVAKTTAGATATVGGAGKQWPTTRFVADTSGNCITDNLTGLMWAQNADLLGTGTWGSSTTAGTAQYKLAQMNTNNSATGYQLCGYRDWRLPNINELGSLINYAATQKGSNPAAWLNSQSFTDVRANYYWSSTAYNGSNAWYVTFKDGYNYSDSISSSYYVWPVRGGR